MKLLGLCKEIANDDRLTQDQKSELLHLVKLQTEISYFMVPKTLVFWLSLIGTIGLASFALQQKTVFPEPIGVSIYGYGCVTAILVWFLQSRSKKTQNNIETINYLVNSLEKQGLKKVVDRVNSS